MPEVNHIRGNFTTGEVSPYVASRVDLEKYYSGCEVLENFNILPQGGIIRRPGMRFVAETKTSSKRSRLVPFEFSIDQAFILEFGHQYIRFFRNNSAIMTTETELVTNGSFDTGISDWTAVPEGGLVGYDGTNKAATLWYLEGDQPGIVQQIAVEEHTTYRVSLDVVIPDQDFVRVNVGSTSLGYEYGYQVYRQSESYSFEFSTPHGATAVHLYIKAFSGGAIPGIAHIDNVSVVAVTAAYEIATPYGESDIGKLSFTQSADVLYLVHPDYAPRKLMRYADTDWALKAIPFAPPPTKEAGTHPNATLTPDAATGLHVAFTPGSDVFLASDVGRQIKYRDSIATIVEVVAGSPKVPHCDITTAFDNTDPIPAGDWLLDGSPNTILTPTAVSPVGAIIDLGLTAAGWRSEDVGKYVRGNSGLAKITEYHDTLKVHAEVMIAFATTSGISGGAWTLEESSWDTGHYPYACCLFEQRFVCGGTDEEPTTLWGSASSDYENFDRGADDGDSVVYTIAMGTVNTIRWLVPLKSLLIGTAAGEMRATGGSENPLTPSNVNIKPESGFGSRPVRPATIGNNVLFVQRSGKKLRDLTFDMTADGYVSADLTELASHIAEGGIVEMDYEQEPHSRVWAARADGVLLSMTYEKGQKVVGWSRHTTDGYVESVATIPHPLGDRDQVWLIVRRLIGGVAKRYVERLDETLCTDCAVTYSGAAAATLTGLSHLEGKELVVLEGGVEATKKTVASGSITLDASSATAEAGLEYLPTATTTRPEVPQMGTAQGKKKRWASGWVRVLNTRGLVINNMPQREDAAVSKDIEMTNLGYDQDGRITITQPHPYPSTILAIFGKLMVGD